MKQKGRLSKGAKKTHQSLSEKHKGFHCLSKWDGAHPEVKEDLKNALYDPDSLKHISTKVSPNNQGTHHITMEFRAKDRAGEISYGTAMGIYSNHTCEHAMLGVDIEE